MSWEYTFFSTDACITISDIFDGHCSANARLCQHQLCATVSLSHLSKEYGALLDPVELILILYKLVYLLIYIMAFAEEYNKENILIICTLQKLTSMNKT